MKNYNNIVSQEGEVEDITIVESILQSARLLTSLWGKITEEQITYAWVKALKEIGAIGDIPIDIINNPENSELNDHQNDEEENDDNIGDIWNF